MSTTNQSGEKPRASNDHVVKTTKTRSLTHLELGNCAATRSLYLYAVTTTDEHDDPSSRLSNSWQ